MQIAETLGTDAEYCDRPFFSHGEYVRALVSISRVHKNYMGDKIRKGRQRRKFYEADQRMSTTHGCKMAPVG